MAAPRILMCPPDHYGIEYEINPWMNRSLGGCQYHVAHPGGLSYDSFPVNSFEAEGRRLSRFVRMGHTPRTVEARAEERNPNFPFTLDLRRSS